MPADNQVTRLKVLQTNKNKKKKNHDSGNQMLKSHWKYFATIKNKTKKKKNRIHNCNNNSKIYIKGKSIATKIINNFEYDQLN